MPTGRNWLPNAIISNVRCGRDCFQENLHASSLHQQGTSEGPMQSLPSSVCSQALAARLGRMITAVRTHQVGHGSNAPAPYFRFVQVSTVALKSGHIFREISLCKESRRRSVQNVISVLLVPRHHFLSCNQVHRFEAWNNLYEDA